MLRKLTVAAGALAVIGVACTSSPTTRPAASSPAAVVSPPGPPASSPAPASSASPATAFDPANFVSGIDNPYLPFTPGTTFVYEGVKEGVTQTDTVVVTSQTKVIAGVTCEVISDVATHVGRLLEKTSDYYAQDKDGNVWYLGEDTAEYDSHGKVKTTEGTWAAGVDGAQAGIFMPAHPEVTDSFRQEFYQGHAEDTFWIVSLTDSVKVPYGSFQNVMRTLEWTRLEPGVIDEKFYAPGIGVVLEQSVEGPVETAKLVSTTTG